MSLCPRCCTRNKLCEYIQAESPLNLLHFFLVPQHALLAADVIVCTPEKWDGISRNWQSRSYVRKVGTNAAFCCDYSPLQIP